MQPRKLQGISAQTAASMPVAACVAGMFGKCEESRGQGTAAPNACSPALPATARAVSHGAVLLSSALRSSSLLQCCTGPQSCSFTLHAASSWPARSGPALVLQTLHADPSAYCHAPAVRSVQSVTSSEQQEQHSKVCWVLGLWGRWLSSASSREFCTHLSPSRLLALRGKAVGRCPAARLLQELSPGALLGLAAV